MFQRTYHLTIASFLRTKCTNEKSKYMGTNSTCISSKVERFRKHFRQYDISASLPCSALFSHLRRKCLIVLKTNVCWQPGNPVFFRVEPIVDSICFCAIVGIYKMDWEASFLKQTVSSTPWPTSPEDKILHFNRVHVVLTHDKLCTELCDQSLPLLEMPLPSLFLLCYPKKMPRVICLKWLLLWQPG